MQGNAFVTYLNTYTTTSPEHEAAFDEYIIQAEPPFEHPLRLQTKTEVFLRSIFQRDHPPSVILTGNAGDGKTYLCRQIVETFTGERVTDWADKTDWRIQRNGFTFRVIKDLSEVGEEAGSDILWELALDQLEKKPRLVFLIAANEGRLRAVLGRERLEELYAEVDRQLREGPDLGNDRFIVLNLNQATTSTYVPQALSWLTEPGKWQSCEGCIASKACPIRFNSERLAQTYIAGRVRYLFQVLEHLGIHATIRDMLIHLAFTITGGLGCEQILEKSRHLGWGAHRHVYYENIWGEATDETFRRKVIVIHYLSRMNVGETSVFPIDDFIINGKPESEEDEAEYRRLFAPSLDLGERRFAQDRDSYVHGGGEFPEAEQQHPLIAWLPLCRRKLFFEWNNTEAADRLFVFTYLPDYFHLLSGDSVALDSFRRHLVLGLNRAFSGLYLTDADYLYVTSQYAHAVEQPVPVVRIRIASEYIDLRVDRQETKAFGSDMSTLVLEIPPPPRVHADPVLWKMDLLCFEYLMRRASGATSNILAEECELMVRHLKDELLLRFASGDEEHNRIDFFAADRNRYMLHTLWMDDEGHIRV